MTLNRRSFLATTAAATAAIGTPMILRAQPAEYVLGGSLPLTVLEAKIDRWIDAQARR